MQFRKNTRPALSSYFSRYILKVGIAVIVIYGVFLLIDRIKFPSPNKIIEKQVPNENIKIIK